jgi:predicted membrane-bound mannosyltransferase
MGVNPQTITFVFEMEGETDFAFRLPTKVVGGIAGHLVELSKNFTVRKVKLPEG